MKTGDCNIVGTGAVGVAIAEHLLTFDIFDQF
jgi:hypothetical protein